MKIKTTTAILFVIFTFAVAASAQMPANTEQQYVAKSLEMMQQENFAEAEKAARMAIRANPKSGEGYTMLAVTLGQIGREQEAQAAFEKALEYLPADSVWRKRLEELMAEDEDDEKPESNPAGQSDETIDDSRIRSGKNENNQAESNTQSTQFKKGTRVKAAYDKVTEIYAGYTPIYYEATIIEADAGRYKVHYEDADFPDAWQEAKYVIAFDAGDTSGGIPLGKYVCYMPVYENTYMGSFQVKSGSIYEYLTGNKGSGKFTYDASTREINWTSGDLAGKNIVGEFTNDKQNGAIITLIFNGEKRKGNIQRCLLKN